MELLSDFDPTDPVSRILRAIRLRSTLYCRSVMGAPWGFGIEAHGNPAFHVVTSGRCWLEVEGESEQLALTAGDLVVIPTGRRHWVRDHPDTAATELQEILATTRRSPDRRLHHGGNGPVTELLCGGFALEGGAAEPILRALPTTLIVRGTAGRPVPWLDATLALLTAEMRSDAPGTEEIVSRLAETLLAQAVRFAVIELRSSGGAGVLAADDPEIAAAVSLIHRYPERAWTVGKLAAEVALSRTTFAARFRRLVGESPLGYVTRARLAHAATLLRTTNESLAQIAARAGYRNASSFGKAFKRALGTAPGAYRAQSGARPDLELAGSAKAGGPSGDSPRSRVAALRRWSAGNRRCSGTQ